jgi:DMSO/TMAO reductase YedYZ molybdopterin-dependent catalytic subunit
MRTPAPMCKAINGREEDCSTLDRFEGYLCAQGRREFLLRAGLPVLALLPCSHKLRGQSPPPPLIIREREPENFEFPFSSLDGFITPNELFYVRNHFPVPSVDLKTYSLRVDGAVDRPFDIGYEELKRLPSVSTTATLECAGNSRVFLIPQRPGAQWELGAVGNAVWTGVSLAALLDRAGVKRGAVDVVLEGLDRGEPRSEPKPPGHIAFARSIPISKALRPEVLLAYQMNNKSLPSSHGFPLRAIVPGFYGMSSVKWLSRIHVVPGPYQGYWQTTDYAYWDRSTGTPARKPLMEMRVKSLIARPALREIVKSAHYRVFGAAWAGDADVEIVELSVDSGRNWVQARLIDKAVRFAWRRWEYQWDVPRSPEPMILMCRATDSRGNRQPEQHDPDMGNYAVHHVLPRGIEVE